MGWEINLDAEKQLSALSRKVKVKVDEHASLEGVRRTPPVDST